jgi:hypothetical protein
MIGEIRDTETADIAIKASLIGQTLDLAYLAPDRLKLAVDISGKHFVAGRHASK